MKYNPSIGIMGNIKLLFNERNKTNNEVFNNKAETDIAITDIEELLIEDQYQITLLQLGIEEV